MASTLLSIAMVVAPVIGYIDQYILIKKNKSSAGFNLVTCGILLSAKYKRDHPVLYTELRASFSSSDIDRDLEAEANGAEPTSFWHWESYLNYIIALLIFTTVVALLYLLLSPYALFIEMLGILSLGIESTLPLPQCISNFRNRSTQGFSLLVLGSWFLGDGFKLFYFVFTQSPPQFIACGSVQLFIDTLIVIECFLFSPSIKQKFSDSSWINAPNECKSPGFEKEKLL
ncbi:PQ loop repeat-domain-containing protein [Sporodiniella umbellata]|nr:PQ loop repeat-domain-containing protein [Sporodiniella umbellata]